uniref:secretory calcium-binding phosphoprotein 9 n=1 Tax=Centroberyx gerrardi TaxID=166262 RepID=UPI003AAF4E20
MKLLLLSTFVATILYVNAGKKQRLMAGLNGGMGNGMGANPGMMAGGMNPPMVAGGAGFIGQPQFAQVVPGVPAYAMQAQTIPNMYPVPPVNALPYMAAPQMMGMNPLQQPFMGVPGGPMQQQGPFQPDPFKRFKRQIMKQANSLKTTVDTQIPTPTETTTTTPCNEDHEEDN